MIVRAKDAKVSEMKKPKEGFGSMTNILYEKVSEYSGNIKMFSKIILHKNSKVGYHLHKTDMEIYLMLDGQALICEDGIEDTVGEGDLIITEKGQSHSIENRTDRDIRFLAVIIE